MSLLSPIFFWLGIAGAALVVAIHLIVTRQPNAEFLPTARFVPESPAESISRDTRPADLLLLLLRTLSMLLIGLAFSRPVVPPERESTVRIILADISRSSKSLSEVRDSALQYFRKNDVIMGFDSHIHPALHPDSISTLTQSADVGNLSTALVAAVRSGRTLRQKGDSISLILISPLNAASWDAATDTIRSLWPGAVNLVRVEAQRDSSETTRRPLATRLDSRDPLGYSVNLAAKYPHDPSVSIARGAFAAPVPGDDKTTVVVHWPARDRPRFARAVNTIDRMAVVSEGTVVVAPFQSRWDFSPDSVRDATVIARWVDGTPAAVQVDSAGTCFRSIAIPLPVKGDLAIRHEFVQMVQAIISPCVRDQKFAVLSDARTAKLKGGTAAAPRNAFEPLSTENSPIARWIIAAALLLLFMEIFLRRKIGQVAASRSHYSVKRAA